MLRDRPGRTAIPAGPSPGSAPARTVWGLLPHSGPPTTAPLVVYTPPRSRVLAAAGARHAQSVVQRRHRRSGAPVRLYRRGHHRPDDRPERPRRVSALDPASVRCPGHARASADACATPDAHQRHAHVGADNPAYPPYLRARPEHGARCQVAARRPAERPGLRRLRRLRGGQGDGLHPGQGGLDAGRVQQRDRPGAKTFDIYLTQVSYSADRTAAVDLSDGYFNLNQAVVALKSNPISKVTTVAGLAAFKLGAPVGTTSYSYITDNIQPTKAPSVYNDLDGALKALQAKQIDGIVVDLPTAFYMRDAQLTGGTIVGYLPTVGDPEYFSVLLAKGSKLTAVRQPGDRLDQGRRDARPDHPEMDLRRGRTGPEVGAPRLLIASST